MLALSKKECKERWQENSIGASDILNLINLTHQPKVFRVIPGVILPELSPELFPGVIPELFPWSYPGVILPGVIPGVIILREFSPSRIYCPICPSPFFLPSLLHPQPTFSFITVYNVQFGAKICKKVRFEVMKRIIVSGRQKLKLVSQLICTIP